MPSEIRMFLCSKYGEGTSVMKISLPALRKRERRRSLTSLFLLFLKCKGAYLGVNPEAYKRTIIVATK
jgi:hypothetical protein